MADDEARIVSVIGGARRTSRWKVAEDTSVLTLFGRCLLDLRQAETDAEELWFSIVSVFATVEVIVPEGTVVQPSGMAFLGGSSCEVPLSNASSQLPAIEIDAVTVFGSLRVHVGQRPRVGLLRRLFRRGEVVMEPMPAPVPMPGLGGSLDDDLVEELRMSEPIDDDLLDFDEVLDELDPEEIAETDDIEGEAPDQTRTSIDELDDVLADVLGDNRDLLDGVTEQGEASAAKASDTEAETSPA